MKQYKSWAAAAAGCTIIGSLAGCGSTTGGNNTTSNTAAVQTNKTGGRSASNPTRVNALTLSVNLSHRTSLPSSRKDAQSYPVSQLRSPYGTIQTSISKKTTKPLQITLTDHGNKNVIYVDKNKSEKWLMGWQVSGNYLFLNIGKPAPNMDTADFGGEAVVINLKTKQMTLKQAIGVESKTQEFITPTALVSNSKVLTGPGNSIVDFHTAITNLATDKSVQLTSTTSYPLGRTPYVLGDRVYFANQHKIYYVEIPAVAWSGMTHKSYKVVLRPSMKITS